MSKLIDRKLIIIILFTINDDISHFCQIVSESMPNSIILRLGLDSFPVIKIDFLYFADFGVGTSHELILLYTITLLNIL